MNRTDLLQLKVSHCGCWSLEEETEFLTRARTLVIECKFSLLPVIQRMSPIQRYEEDMMNYLKQLLEEEGTTR